MWSRSLASRAKRSRDAFGAVADDKQPQIVVEDAKEVGGPDEILDALLRPESADDADQPASGGHCSSWSSSARETSLGRAGGDAVGNDDEAVGGEAVLGAIVADGGAIGDEAIGVAREAAIDDPLPGRLPAVDAVFAGDDVFDAGEARATRP